MAMRPSSWQQVPAIGPPRGAVLNGYGLDRWRAAAPDALVRSRFQSSRARSRSGAGRGQPNDLERLVAERAIEKKDDFNPLNAGGRMLMGVLDALDTPRAAVASSMHEFQDLAGLGGQGESASFQDWLRQTRGNITTAEATGLSDYAQGQSGPTKLGATLLGFAGDVAIDPLTYIGGGAAKVGEEAGLPAARAFLKDGAKEALGEAAAKAAEREGTNFADNAARAAFVKDQGDIQAARAAQKAVKFHSNQALSDLEREVIGATPGTYARLPGKTLGIDKVLAKILPEERVVEGQHGRSVFRLTKRELGAGRVAGHVRAAVAESKFGNKLAELFTKYPEMRKAMLFGPPEDAAKAILGMDAASARGLQERLFGMTWETQWADLSKRARKAGINGEDLRYAAAEQMGGEAAGPSLNRVMAQAAAKGDQGLAEELKTFFPRIEEAANSIDPEHPWLMHRDNYTANIMSDEQRDMGNFWGDGSRGRQSIDMRQAYGLAADQKDTLFGEKLLPPEMAKGRSVRQQIDDILQSHGVPAWFEKDAYKAFPEYIRRVSRRYGDEYMAKQLRDLGLAELGWVKQLSEKGYSQAKAKAAIVDMAVRATSRANKAEEAAKAAREAADFGQEGVRRAETMVGRAGAETERLGAAERALRNQADLGDVGAVREYEGYLRDQAATIGVRRNALMDQIDQASDELFALDHATVEQAHSINLETYHASERVTRLEQRQADLREELGYVFDNLDSLNREGSVAAETVRAMKASEQRVVGITSEIRSIEDLLVQFEDLAAMPTDQLEQQLARVDQQLSDVVQEYDAITRGAMEPTYSTPHGSASVTPSGYVRNVRVQSEFQGTGEGSALMSQIARDADERAVPLTAHARPDLHKWYERFGFKPEGEDALGPLLRREPNQNLVNKINALADVKASILHEKGVVERARGRIAEIDRSHPEALLGEMDNLTRQQDMADKLVHSLFPDLPDDVNGARIRSYMQDRIPELQQQIDDTQAQVISAYADRDTMRVELAQTRAQRREAQRNLRKITKQVKLEDRALWAQQDELLRQADEAMNNALKIDAQKEAIEEHLGDLAPLKQDNEYAARIAEGYLSAMHARQLRYEATALGAEQNVAHARKVQQTWQKIARDNLGKDVEEVLVSALNDQYKALGAVSMTKDAWLVDGLRAATVMREPAALRPVFRLFDKVQNVWKAYALSTPGTVMRNLFGGVFNNWLAGGVKAADYEAVMAWKMGRGVAAEDKALLDQIRQAGVLTGSGTTLEVEHRAVPANLRPWTSDFAMLKEFRRAQNNAEELLRGSLALRTLKEGGTMEDAIGRVMKYHFDYDDISAFERSIMRRLVPFYTWSRKNFPLMLEQIVQNPQKFARFYQLKNNIELYSPQKGIVPSYFSENLSVRLPFGVGQGQGYVLPDLPFTSLVDQADPTLMFSQVTPFVKTPLEYAFGKQVFKGIPLKDEYQPVPHFMEFVPGLFPALEHAGIARKGADGSWYMKQKNMYVAEQMMPSFGKARRLFPSEESYNQRTLSSWLSFAFGIGLRTNTPNEQRNEAARRVYAGLERINTQKELGYLVPGQDKLPRPGQTLRAAYERLGVAR